MTFKSYLKQPRVINKKFLKWTAEQGCVITGRSDCIPHHIKDKSIGGMGIKADDYLVFALISKFHDETSPEGLHRDKKKWESKHQLQAYYVIENLNNALNQGVISEKIWKKYIEICERIIDVKENN